MRARIEELDDLHDVHVYEANKDDLDAVAKHCADMRAIGATGTKDWKVAASVPGFFVQKYINDNGITFREFMRDEAHINRFLADPALAHFRIWQGRV